jgi:lysophospholipase L1-like esterase
VGNSITANQNGFVSFLDRSLPHRSFANMGVVGEGAAAIARRLERNVVGRGFDEVIIEAGINDIGRRDALEYIPRQLAAMVRTAKAAGLKVVLTTLPPWQDQATRIMAINQRIKNEGRTWGADVIVDIHRPLADWRGGLRSDLIGDRMGLHPTRAGQELIGRAILESAYS